ncbi:Uncharacterised protein [Mycobacteroides abscessus subsp. abscessus]|nr:Uncharacterised protein [Mycobacteroides abscessus subsp. abscessus]
MGTMSRPDRPSVAISRVCGRSRRVPSAESDWVIVAPVMLARGSCCGPDPARPAVFAVDSFRDPAPAEVVSSSALVVRASESSETPEVPSHASAQPAMSRSGAASARQSRKSASSVLPKAKRLK